MSRKRPGLEHDRRAGAPRRGRRRGDVEAFETLFKALADRTRLRILGLLLGGDVCVCDIHESLRIPQPRASRHLAYLRRAGLVQAHKRGLWVHYRLAPLEDAVAATVLQAVAHGLGHLPGVARDRRRLERRTGCCPPAAVPRLLACCADAIIAAAPARESAPPGSRASEPAPTS